MDKQLTINLNIDKNDNLIINELLIENDLLEKKINLNRVVEVKIFKKNHKSYLKEKNENIKVFLQNILKKECFDDLHKILFKFRNQKSELYILKFSIDFDIQKLLNMCHFDFELKSEKIKINSESIENEDIKIEKIDKDKITFEYPLIKKFKINVKDHEKCKQLSCFKYKFILKYDLDKEEFPAKIDPTILNKNDLFRDRDLTLNATLPLSEKKKEYEFGLFLIPEIEESENIDYYSNDESKSKEKEITSFTVVVYPKKERECEVEFNKTGKIELSKNEEVSIANLNIRKKHFNEEEYILLDREINYQIELDSKAKDYFDVYFDDNSKDIKINTAECQKITKQVKLRLKKLPKQENGQVKILVKENGNKIKSLELNYQIAKCQTFFDKEQNLDVLSVSQSISVGTLKITKESSSADIIINREITYQIDLEDKINKYFDIKFDNNYRQIKINTAECQKHIFVYLSLNSYPSDDSGTIKILLKANNNLVSSTYLEIPYTFEKFIPIFEQKILYDYPKIQLGSLYFEREKIRNNNILLIRRSEIKLSISIKNSELTKFLKLYFYPQDKNEITINPKDLIENKYIVYLKIDQPPLENGNLVFDIKLNNDTFDTIDIPFQLADYNINIIQEKKYSDESIKLFKLEFKKKTIDDDKIIIIDRNIKYKISGGDKNLKLYFDNHEDNFDIETYQNDEFEKNIFLEILDKNKIIEEVPLKLSLAHNKQTTELPEYTIIPIQLEEEIYLNDLSIEQKDYKINKFYKIGQLKIRKTKIKGGNDKIIINRDYSYRAEVELDQFKVSFLYKDEYNNEFKINSKKIRDNVKTIDIYISFTEDISGTNTLNVSFFKLDDYLDKKTVEIKTPKLAKLDFIIEQSEDEVSGQVENFLIAKAIFRQLEEYELGYFHQNYKLFFELDMPENFKKIVKVSFENNKQDFTISTLEVEQQSLEKGINLTVTENPKKPFILKIKVIAKNTNNENDKKEKEFKIKIRRKIEGALSLNFYHKDEDIDILEDKLIIDDKKGKISDSKQKYKDIQIILSTRDEIQQFLYLKFENDSEISNYKIEFDTDEQQCFILNKNIDIEAKTEGNVKNKGNIAIFGIDPVCIFFDRKEVEIKDFTLKYTIYKNGKPILNNKLTFNLKFVPEYYFGEVFLDLGTSAIAILWTPKDEYKRFIIYSSRFYDIRKRDSSTFREQLEKEPLISSLMIVENIEKLNEIKNEFPKKDFKERPFILSPFKEEVEQAKIILPSVKVLISSNKMTEYITQKLKYEMLNDKLGFDLYKELIEPKLYLTEVLNQIFHYFIRFSLDERSNKKFAIPKEFRQQFDLKNIQKLYFSVPNTFTKKINDIILETFEKIGIKKKNIYLVRESDSVAFTYYYHTGKSAVKNLLIYDIGAGTLDISYFEKTDNEIKLISRLGLNTGGNYIDYVIATILLELMGGKKMDVKFKNKDRKIVLLFKTVIKNIKENLAELQNRLIDYLQAEGEKGKQFKEFLEKTLELKNYETKEDTLKKIIEHKKYGQLLTNIVDEALNRFKNLTQQKLKKEIKPDLVLLSGRAAKLYGLKEKIEEYFKGINVEFIYENEVIKHTFSKLFDDNKNEIDLKDIKNENEKDEYLFSLMLKYIVPYGSYAYSQLKEDYNVDLETIELANYGFIYKPATSTKEKFKKIDINKQKIEHKFEENIDRKVEFVKTYSDDPTKDSDDLKDIFTNFLYDFDYEKGNIIKLEKNEEDNIVEIDVSGKLNKFSLNDMQKNGAFKKSQWPFSFISDET